MAEESEYELEPFREGAAFRLYRGRERSNQRPILAAAVAADLPSAQNLGRLDHEFALADDLDAAWAARPLALTRHQGQTILILEDPGGEPLDRIIQRHKGQPLALTLVLRIAIGLAAALGQAHRQGLIHKDIKPANALVDESGRVWLTGFGIASRLPRERQSPDAPEFIAGSLPYMAPEQTGRMNRSIDSRSDLYSLGVTLYEMSTGRLPFSASEPMEWVHCQIARQPVPPRERTLGIPGPVSAIILKLLAKAAEERYQTATGLQRDLQRCLDAWDIDGHIDEFPLGEHDTPDRLLIPEKLYGRTHEVATLLGAFQRVVATGAPELVLVSGYSGIGKSSVVNELHKVLVPFQGLFAAGKFDQYKRDIPYATLAQAFQNLVRQILGKSEMELRPWRDALHEALDLSGALIVDLIPELALIIGEQPPVPDLSPQDAQRRFHSVLRRFIGVFARPEHPLVLFLDDLQWLDAATIDLLEDLLTQQDFRHLLLIGAYRDNEVDAAHPLMRKLDAIRRTGAVVHDIVLGPLNDDDLGRLITESLHCEASRARPLIRLVQEKTGGNAFFAIQFLQALADEALLTFDHAKTRWSWDLDRIHAKRYTDNVVDLMVAKLHRLPAETCAVLCQLACIGSGATAELLGTACQISLEDLHGRLWEAVRAGMVRRSAGAYAFEHDRVQEAAYSLIPEGIRAESHLRIGRLLLADTPPERLDEIVFDIVSQFNRSVALISAPDQRAQLAQLNLLAGKRARNAAAYASALTYLAEGWALLAEDCWTRQYALAFELELYRAECEFLTGDLVQAEERLAGLARCAADLVDQAAVTCLRIDLYVILVRSERAVDIGLDYLAKVGLEMSPCPTDSEVRREYERVWQLLGTRRIEDLIDLPPMNDPGRRATIDVLNKLMLSALYLDQKLHQLLGTHMVNFSMAHGNSAASCVAYVWFGRVLAFDLGDYASALRFGQLGLDLVDKPGFDAFRARVYFIFGTGISSWAQHLRLGRGFLARASEEAKKNGDLPYIGYCYSNIVGNLLSSGEALPEVDRVAMEGLHFAQGTGSGIVVAYILGQLRLIRSLRGLPCDFKAFDNEAFDAAAFERRLGAQPNLTLAADIYWSRRLQAFVFAADYASALDAAERPQTMLGIMAPNIEHAEYHFYAALARAGAITSADAEQPDQQSAHLEALKTHHRQLERWADHCPENFESRAALVGAELARLEGRDGQAQQLYEQAIRSARANGFVHIEAVANELAGRFYLASGIETAGDAYLRNARNGYDRWGAAGKVKQLDEAYPHLRAESPSAASVMIGPSAGQLDFETVVKASQALSREMVLPKLIEQLMRIAVEHAGAERGVLILLRDGEPRIEAEAAIDAGRIEVAVRHSAINPADLLRSVLHYALRTQECLLLDDASADAVYSKDDYVRLKHSRSVLCLPIVKQAKLVGALYLENNLTPGAFTPDRVAVLQMLASQAAISLENAILYTDLQLQVGLLQRLPVSAWTLRPDGTPDFVNEVWLEFAGQTLDFVRSHPEAWMTAIHPEDREIAAKSFWEGVQAGEGFAIENRSLRAEDGTYRWHLAQAVVLRDADGKVVKFVGTTTDIDDQKRTEEALRQAQGDLARINRVTTMGELAASLAHEISQPISGAVINADVCQLWLGSDKPDLDELRAAVGRFARDAKRAAEILKRIRSQFVKGPANQELLDFGEIIRETVTLLRGEVTRYNIAVRTELAADLPRIVGDRVQLQQVAMNLIVNSIEAMKEVDGLREMTIGLQRGENDQILVSLSDTGIGFSPERAEQIFDPFYTTKLHGTGMGLRISRSIIESHQGRLWATGLPGRGATFHLSLPAAPAVSQNSRL